MYHIYSSAFNIFALCKCKASQENHMCLPVSPDVFPKNTNNSIVNKLQSQSYFTTSYLAIKTNRHKMN